MKRTGVCWLKLDLVSDTRLACREVVKRIAMIIREDGFK